MTSKSLTHLVFGVLFGCLFLQTAMAQISIGGKPYSFALRTHTMSPLPVLMPGINIGKLEAEDLLDEQAGLAPRFGDLIEVSLNTNNSGVWETLPDGGRLWRLSIMAAGAKSINLLYDDFYLPDGGVLYIYSADRKHVIGGFTSANNKADRIFATGLVYSDHIVLEYYEPAEVIAKRAANNVAEEASISINYVVHGYRFIEFNPNDLVKAFGSSGSCNVNTICSQGDNWRDQIKSVVMLLSGGSRFCTGYLVNNTAQDCRPLLLTANHCLGTADAISSPSVNTWTFMWRYESPNCTPNTDGPTNMTTSGGTVLANPGSPGSIFSSDFALIELAENPKTAGYDVYFAGFDATTTAPSSATGIHHPSGDVKKISMENAALTGTSYSSTGGTATHWRVADWDSGTTEPGSSGSPIFSDATKRAMGFLSGGGAACGNDLSDWYGSLGYSWNNNGASDSRRRLRDHLDPGNLATFVDGSANPCNSNPPGPCTGTTYSSAANLNLPIPDNNPTGVSSTITVATVATVTELKCVTVNLTHTWTGDLVATLTHVSSGTSVQLFRRLNATTPTAVGESSNLSGAYTFCATGASFATAGNGGLTDYVIPPGTYAQSSASLQLTPAQNTNTFANFVGLALNGQWRLTVSDYSADDIGTLSNWSFEACSDAPTCPTFSGAPANVTIVNSTCSSNVVSGGSITAPTGTPCPAGSTLQYNVDNTGWTTTLPSYNQTGPAQSIKTRCACDSDANTVSAESTAVTTIPGSCAPANDLCANATPISCGITISSSNINATAEPGSFAPCGVVQTTAGVWYTFTGDGTNVTLSTCSAANFDTKISVYTGGCTTPTCVAGNDDACPGGLSSVTFTTANGTVYLILIHGFGGVTGTFDLTMTCVAPCPTFSGAPANVSISNSTCGSGCTLTGGSITAPAGTPCPAGSTLQYNVNNSGWTTSLPSYNQSGPAQTIRTRCACNNDGNNVSAESNPVSTIPGTLANPVVPANGSAIVACPALATQPTPPTVMACDGSPITPSGPVISNSPNPVTCEGTRTYTWTYSCGGTSSIWSFVYTIERNPFTVPANGAATVNSPSLATQPTPPTVTSNCGEVLTPSGPAVTNVPDPIVCAGTRTYAWTYTDCEGNTAVWSFVYTIIDNTPPTATCHNQTITFNGQESITLNANDLVTVSDNCGTPSITLSPSFITCQQVGQIVPVVITVKDASNNTVTCTANVTVGGLPCGWSQNPNGVNCANGNSIAYNAATGVYTATSTGCFYGPPFTGDATAFAQRTLCGNGSITALVTGINPLAGGWAGIVMRENNTAGAKKAQLMTNLGSDHRREFRIATNGSAQVQQFPSQNRYWLRITRVGNQFTMFVSSNGVNWFPAGAQNIVMPSCIQMGLVATNYTANSTVTATFSNVSFTGSNSGLGSPFAPDVFTPLHSPLTPDFDVYPNPTGGELNVDLANYVGRAVRLEVYSLEGKLLQFTELDEVQHTLERLDLKGLQNGMYLVKVKSAGLPDATRRVVLARE